MGTLTIIWLPAEAFGGHVTCIWPDGVLTRKGMPGPTPAGTVTCISMEMLRWWQEMANSGGVLKGAGAAEKTAPRIPKLRRHFADHIVEANPDDDATR